LAAAIRHLFLHVWRQLVPVLAAEKVVRDIFSPEIEELGQSSRLFRMWLSNNSRAIDSVSRNIAGRMPKWCERISPSKWA